MDGATLNAGAVADVTHTRHPISLARAVIEKSPHVFLVGPGADAFSVQAGLEQEPQSFFFTERRWQSLIKQLQQEGLPIPARPEGVPPPPAVPVADAEPPLSHKWGTVGVVALDRKGNIARRHFDGRHAGKALGARGRLADHRGRHVCVECVLRRVGDRRNNVFIRLTIAAEICSLVRCRNKAATRLGPRAYAAEVVLKPSNALLATAA